jgi:hypothetical protein
MATNKVIDTCEFLAEDDTVLIVVFFSIGESFDFETSTPTAQDIEITAVTVEGVSTLIEVAEEILNTTRLESMVAKEKFGTY